MGQKCEEAQSLSAGRREGASARSPSVRCTRSLGWRWNSTRNLDAVWKSSGSSEPPRVAWLRNEADDFISRQARSITISLVSDYAHENLDAVDRILSWLGGGRGEDGTAVTRLAAPCTGVKDLRAVAMGATSIRVLLSDCLGCFWASATQSSKPSEASTRTSPVPRRNSSTPSQASRLRVAWVG